KTAGQKPGRRKAILAVLFDAGAGELDDLLPLLGFRHDDLAEILRRAAHRHPAEIGDPLLEVVVGKTLVHRLVEHRDHILRRLTWRAHAEPGARLVALHRVAERWHVRQLRRALLRGHGERAELAALD